MFACARCASLAAFAAPVGARSVYVRVTSTPTAALSKLSAKVNQEGIEKMLKARKNYIRPSLLRQKNASNAVYHKVKKERVKLVEELVLQKAYFPW